MLHLCVISDTSHSQTKDISLRAGSKKCGVSDSFHSQIKDILSLRTESKNKIMHSNMNIMRFVQSAG